MSQQLHYPGKILPQTLEGLYFFLDWLCSRRLNEHPLFRAIVFLNQPLASVSVLFGLALRSHNSPKNGSSCVHTKSDIAFHIHFQWNWGLIAKETVRHLKFPNFLVASFRITPQLPVMCWVIWHQYNTPICTSIRHTIDPRLPTWDPPPTPAVRCCSG